MFVCKTWEVIIALSSALVRPLWSAIPGLGKAFEIGYKQKMERTQKSIIKTKGLECKPCKERLKGPSIFNFAERSNGT